MGCSGRTSGFRAGLNGAFWKRGAAPDRVRRPDSNKEDGEKDQQFDHVAMIAWLCLTGWTTSELEKGRREGNPDTPTAYRDNPTSLQRL